MVTDDHYDGNYQERSSCVRCPDLWRSQSSVPEEQQYHTWLAIIRNNGVAKKKTVCFILPFKQQHHNTLASFMSITTLSLLCPLLVPVLIQDPHAINIICKETTTKMRMEPGADPQLRIREDLL